MYGTDLSGKKGIRAVHTEAEAEERGLRTQNVIVIQAYTIVVEKPHKVQRKFYSGVAGQKEYIVHMVHIGLLFGLLVGSYRSRALLVQYISVYGVRCGVRRRLAIGITAESRRRRLFIPNRSSIERPPTMFNFKNVAFGLIGAAAIASASDVHDLKTDTFPAFIAENPLVLAEFFAPWCGHCKALAPEYEEAATSLKEKDIKLVKVDCTEEAELCQSYGVEGYPTLKVFRGADNIAPYSGPRKADAITSYMIKQSLPAVSVLDAETIEEFKTADKVVVVAYVDAEDKASADIFTAIAEAQRDSFLFGTTSDAALAAADGVTAPAVVVYKKFDEGKNTYTEKFVSEDIDAFIKTSSTPLVGEVGPETYAGYMAANIPLAYIFAETAEERTELAELLKPLAEEYKGVVNFATIDAKAFGAHAGNLNLKVDSFPAFAIQEIAKNQKFPFDQEKKITLADITTFVKSFVDGKLEPSIKSEPIPEVQEGVTVVVALNYDEVVINNEKDVLLEFYAPWCGHCKSLAPKYDELAALYAADADVADKVTIAKVDATANDVPDEIQGFPTIKLFPAGSKDAPITYSGARTVEDLVKFVAENGKYKASVVVPEPVEEVKEAAGEAAEAAAEAAEEATEAVKEKAAEATEAVKEAVEDHDEL
ncbi:hypothetical protein O988_04606 [Pseudogymnoascus sp. VKM F-3808]|nr:hypothetical protein O988_04606 [Pseudogymnoascus sp. VKM F-3808]